MTRILKSTLAVVGLATLVALATSQRAIAAPVVIDTMPVLNAGNAADPRVMQDGSTGRGDVAYDFRISTYEVTNAQYAEFLNAVGRFDTKGLWDSGMQEGQRAGIRRDPASGGGYFYSVKPGFADKPINLVSWVDAARFVNWLHNGQGGEATTEYGVYDFSDADNSPSNRNSVTRNPNATWWLPNADEWHKAAYYNADSQTYSLYGTDSNTTPIASGASSGTNAVNYNNVTGNVSDVDSLPNSDSYYGLQGVSGNVSEWVEDTGRFVAVGPHQVLGRKIMGGGFSSPLSRIVSDFSFASDTALMNDQAIGFRVATIYTPVPEPSTLVLGTMAAAALTLVIRRRRNR